ncbi:MAG: carboxylesterase family protein [Deltaproteobacteria bacterium]|nr:MAG: carboxylesterase family protein [Deltaproteobacteria bacterium]
MDTRVEIASGRLRGAEDRGRVVFRGVPYARPPVHERAFRAPQPPDPWSGTRAAIRFGSAAPQFVPPTRIVRGLIGVPADRQSQDCLTLNVWTPAPDAARRPVMVWIHGGAFVMGTGATFLYHGARLARRGDAVVVTINYRLGALGHSRPDPRARVGARQHRGVRRRSPERDDLRRVGRRDERGDAARGAGRARAVPPRDPAERRNAPRVERGAGRAHRRAVPRCARPHAAGRRSGALCAHGRDPARAADRRDAARDRTGDAAVAAERGRRLPAAHCARGTRQG